MPYKDKIKQKQYQALHYLNNREKYKERNKSTREKIRGYIRMIKEETPCADCKINYPYWIMDFDHLENKSDSISNLSRIGNINTVLKEIAKCDVVCSNCHRDRTYKRLKDNN